MKNKRLLLLLLVLSFLLSSCIQPDESLEDTATGKTEEHTLPVWDPALPVWSSDDALAAAQAVLRSPSGGIVDASKSDYSYDEMTEDLKALATVYPEHFSYRSIGRSVAGRELYVAVLGNPDAERQVVVSAAIHAREYMTALLTVKQLEFYLANYDGGSYGGIPYSVLFSHICFYIVPMTNPDGVMLSQKGLSSLPTEELRDAVRKMFETEQHSYRNFDLYLAHWKANARGVDLNRNYDALWAEYAGANAPQSSRYKGASAGSEPETQAMVTLIEGLKNVVCVLCIHSQGEVLYWNCGQEKEAAARTLSFAKAISARNGYYVVPEQNNDASLSDWCELKQSTVSVTVEIGKGTYILPIEQFSGIWLSNYDLLPLTAAYFL